MKENSENLKEIQNPKDENNNIKLQIKEELLKLSETQLKLKEKNKGIILIVDGFGLSGRGTLIDKIIDVLDPKFYKVENISTEIDNRKPFMTKYYEYIPEIGKISIFDASYLTELANLKNNDDISDKKYRKIINSINIYERQLVDNGYIPIKIFLDIDKKEQNKRIKNLLSDSDLNWKVSDTTVIQNKNFSKYKNLVNELIKKTNPEYAKWNRINEDNKRKIVLESLKIINKTIEKNIDITIDTITENTFAPKLNQKLNKKIKLQEVKLNKTISDEDYNKELKRLQNELNSLQNKIYKLGIPVVIAYEGWDAAGKGGNIKRLTKSLDPRSFEIYPIPAPTAEEKNRHYLWRFWKRIPKTGHFSIFDRSWYGRVMVERIEGFCGENDWKRAYNEINEFEKELTDFGTVVIKFWVQIDKDTQLKRFKARQNTPEKQWKITDEDWRNREKWDIYEYVVQEMLDKTNTKNAPWYVIESNDKKYARIKTLRIVIDEIKKKISEIEK